LDGIEAAVAELLERPAPEAASDAGGATGRVAAELVALTA
jgi:hypothetical protein